MLRKILLTAAVLAIVGALFFGRDAISYVRTSACWFKDSVKNSVPVEFEIERARKMVHDLVPDIRRAMHVIAKEEVEMERLEREIAQAETRLAEEKENVLRLKRELQSQKEHYVFAGRTYTPEQVKWDLAARFERYKTHDATLSSLRDIRLARTRSLEAARQKLDGMLAAKRQLEVDVENLEARLKMVEVAQTASDVNVDDSRLGRAKELITELRTRLDVAERIVNAQGTYQGEIPLDDSAAENILTEVEEYFDPSPSVPLAASH